MTSQGSRVSKGPLHKALKAGNRNFHPTTRASTPPDSQINKQNDLSRDELAKTTSTHNDKRRKKDVTHDESDEEGNEHTPSSSPKRAVGVRQLMCLQS